MCCLEITCIPLYPLFASAFSERFLLNPISKSVSRSAIVLRRRKPDINTFFFFFFFFFFLGFWVKCLYQLFFNFFIFLFFFSTFLSGQERPDLVTVVGNRAIGQSAIYCIKDKKRDIGYDGDYLLLYRNLSYAS